MLEGTTVIAPLPVFNVKLPPKVKFPFQVSAFTVLITVFAEASNVVPAAITSEPPVPVELPFPPKAVAEPSFRVPWLRVVVPAYGVLTPFIVRREVELFWVTAVTLAPTAALINVRPVPEPELVIAPALFTEVVESVMPLSVELLLFSTKLPEPVTPPDTVSSAVPEEFVKVVPLLLSVTAFVLIVKADVVLF